MPTLAYLRLDDSELLLEAQLEYPILPADLRAELVRRGLCERLRAFLNAALRSPR